MKKISALALAALGTAASAQTADTFNFFDPGTRWMGAASAFNVTAADTFSMLNNPAGLAYISGKQHALTYRSRARSRTAASGSLANPTLSSSNFRGSNAIGHLAYATPLNGGGSLAIGYTAGGHIKDLRQGQNLISGGFNNVNYSELVEAYTDFYSVAKGTSNADGSRAFGYGLVIANFSVDNRQLATVPGTPQTVLIDSDQQGDATGVGAVVGWQSTVAGNSSLGVSLRTPISLNGSSFARSAVRTLPGQASVGWATRSDNLRGGNDYLLLGWQVNHYFGASTGSLIPRKNQTTVGVGAEYTLVRSNANLPIRLGFLSVPSGGTGFANRNSFTWGFGYEPKSKPWAAHLNYGSQRSGGGSDFALMLSYKLEK